MRPAGILHELVWHRDYKAMQFLIESRHRHDDPRLSLGRYRPGLGSLRFCSLSIPLTNSSDGKLLSRIPRSHHPQSM